MEGLETDTGEADNGMQGVQRKVIHVDMDAFMPQSSSAIIQSCAASR